MHRRVRHLIAAGSTLAVLTGGASTASAVTPELAEPGLDQLVGAPGAYDTGAIEFRFEEEGTVQLTPRNDQAGQRFGTAVALTQLHTISPRQFLVVTAPGLTVDGKENAGGLYVYERVGTTFEYLDLLTMDHPDVPGEAQAGAEFGRSMDVASMEDHEPTTVTAGVPGLDVDGVQDAGGVIEMYLSRYVDDELPSKSTLYTLADENSPRPPHAGDRLGEVVSTRWWGAPSATVNGQAEAGFVVQNRSYLETEFEIFHQGTKNIQGAPEAGDRFGSAIEVGEEVWIGVPGEDVGTVRDAGMVNGLRSSEDTWDYGGSRAFTQNTADDGSGKPVEGVAEAGDRFGSSVCQLWDDALYVGSPGETIRDVVNAGSVTGLLGADSESQETVGGTVSPHEEFGATVHCDSRWLQIGAPGYAADTGMVVYNPDPRSTKPWSRWRLQDGEPGDGYGSGRIAIEPVW
ncbi:MAG TPA: hypothetical protein VI076_02150 [Actinopolymorphaceae bacterium]